MSLSSRVLQVLGKSVIKSGGKDVYEFRDV
jgi:hypothetical protein